MKTITQTEFCKAALKMPDRASADQLVTEYAKHRELDPDYVRWFIVAWTEKNDHYQVAIAKKLYSPGGATSSGVASRTTK
ncbi:MAG TPA: hypothetical protein DEH78_12285 [Solibacterales bacterium]|nr:hypothetical protein [Bryobacterales bacterium]